MIQLAISGATGRMGQHIKAVAQDDERVSITVELQHDSSIESVTDSLRACDVLIDFSTDAGAARAAELARDHNLALLVGTTALSDATLDTIKTCAQKIAVMMAPNTSRGVAVMNHLLALAAAVMADHADIDLIESHHSQKRDAPSGTALQFAETLRKYGATLPDDCIHAIRAGDIPGEHAVQFACPGERIKISHFATSRDVFARGAVDAAVWLHDQPPGSYRIEHSLGLNL